MVFLLYLFIYCSTNIYNLEKRGISSGFDFLHVAAGYDISISLIPFTSEDTHLRAYFVGFLNTLMIAVCGCFLATIIGFLVGVIRLSSNWLFQKYCLCLCRIYKKCSCASSNRSLLQYSFTSSKNKTSNSFI